MPIVDRKAVFTPSTPVYYVPVPPLALMYAPQQIAWGPLLLAAAAGLGVAALCGAFDDPAPRRCGTCGKSGHDTRTCRQNASKRVPLCIVKTGWCTCCNRRFERTEGHHYAGPADGTKGREMCGTCHLVCGHDGHWQNMARNPRYCRL
jgi:hypothetical protein